MRRGLRPTAVSCAGPEGARTAGLRPPPPPSLPILLLVLPLLLPLLLSGAAPVRADEVDRDLEPKPPWVFFDEPDPKTAEEITDLVKRFDDINQAGPSREALVRRYGVLSAPRLVRVLGAEGMEARNEPNTWNAALTSYALRNTWGNAREIWPLVRPLVDLLEQGREPYRQAFSALAIGAFRSAEFAPDPPSQPDRLLNRVPEIEYRKYLEKALAVLGRRVTDDHPHVRVAVALALGKSGAPGARALLDAKARLGRSDTSDKVVAPRQAVLLAVGLLPGLDDEPLFRAALKDEQRDIRRAGALAAALQVFHDPVPTWTRSPDRLLRALKAEEHIRMHLEDGAETVFARGVLAAAGLAKQEWRLLFDIARQPSTKADAARSAAQCLLFCREPWFPDLMRSSVTEGVDLKPVVLAAFLLRIGEEALAEGVGLCQDYLVNPGLSPRADDKWDVRYFAAVGMLRALATGKLTDPELRAKILSALDRAVQKGLKPGPFREALGELLDLERRPLKENPHYRVSEERILKLESTFRDPHGLFARDLQDMAVVRLNDMVPIVFNVNSLKPGTVGSRDKTEMPRRYLKLCQEQFPYFSRLDLRADRGRRPWPEMPRTNNPSNEVRQP